MKILFVCQYYPPDIGAGATRISDFATGLKKKGHNVTVLTAFPHYPSGIIPKEYNKKLFSVENINGVKVIRTWLYSKPKRTTINRMLNYFSFMFIAPLGLLLTDGKFDVCIISPPPPLTMLSLYPFKLFKFKKLIIDIRDLWPESITAYSQMKQSKLLNILGMFIHKIYSKADKVTVTSYGQEAYLLAKGIVKDKSKVTTITNGVNENIYGEYNKNLLKQKLITKYNLKPNTKIAIYLGNLGLGFEFENVLKSFKFLDDYHLFIIGAGPKKDKIIKFINSNKLNNITYLPPKNKKELKLYLGGADIGLLPTKESPVFDQVIHAKLFEYLYFNLYIVGLLSKPELIELNRNDYCYFYNCINTINDWKKGIQTYYKFQQKSNFKFELENRISKLFKIIF